MATLRIWNKVCGVWEDLSLLKIWNKACNKWQSVCKLKIWNATCNKWELVIICETTTTTTCVPEGDYEYSTDFASSYTPVIGEIISFIGSAHDTCEAIDVVNVQQMGAFNWFEVDIYSTGGKGYYYLHSDCSLLPTGYYVYNGEGGFGVHVTDGLVDQYNICETTTTTSPEP